MDRRLAFVVYLVLLALVAAAILAPGSAAAEATTTTAAYPGGQLTLATSHVHPHLLHGNGTFRVGFDAHATTTGPESPSVIPLEAASLRLDGCELVATSYHNTTAASSAVALELRPTGPTCAWSWWSSAGVNGTTYARRYVAGEAQLDVAAPAHQALVLLELAAWGGVLVAGLVLAAPMIALAGTFGVLAWAIPGLPLPDVALVMITLAALWLTYLRRTLFFQKQRKGGSK